MTVRRMRAGDFMRGTRRLGVGESHGPLMTTKPLVLRIAIVLAIAVRLFLILILANSGRPNVFRIDDSITYTVGAQSLASRGEYVDMHGRPELFRTPGYPLAIALFVALHASDAAIVALNIVFAVLVVFVTWRMARELFGDDRVAGI